MGGQKKELLAKTDAIRKRKPSPDTAQNVTEVRKRARQMVEQEEEPEFNSLKGWVRALEKSKERKEEIDGLKKELAKTKKKLAKSTEKIAKLEGEIAIQNRRRYTRMIGDAAAGLIAYMKHLDNSKLAREPEVNAWAAEWTALYGTPPTKDRQKRADAWRAFRAEPTKLFLPRFRQERNDLRAWKEQKQLNPGMITPHPQIPHLVRLKTIAAAANPNTKLDLDFMWEVFEIYEERNQLAHSGPPNLEESFLPSSSASHYQIDWAKIQKERRAKCLEIKESDWISEEDQKFGVKVVKAWELTFREKKMPNRQAILSDFGKKQQSYAWDNTHKQTAQPMMRDLDTAFLESIFPQDVQDAAGT